MFISTSVILCGVLPSPDVDPKPNTEQAGAPGGAAAEPSTSQPQKTEESEKTADQPDESKVDRRFDPEILKTEDIIHKDLFLNVEIILIL